jgi:hypothetical protein
MVTLLRPRPPARDWLTSYAALRVAWLPYFDGAGWWVVGPGPTVKVSCDPGDDERTLERNRLRAEAVAAAMARLYPPPS